MADFGVADLVNLIIAAGGIGTAAMGRVDVADFMKRAFPGQPQPWP